tara:strand:- start:2296 stop:2922 length:627 start_codon:yes stop_codon:yes gene_type:complete
MKRINVLGNGNHAGLFQRGTEGTLLICNMPPMELPPSEVFATCMVDYKMMQALWKGQFALDQYDWILGTRPRHWMQMQGSFYMKYASCIKGFYEVVPEYAGNATNFNCGHFAVHYACNKMNADEVHIYGFDSIFEMDLTSWTDTILHSDRETQNTVRLANNWRPIWTHMFNEFPDTKFVLYHSHDNIKIPISDNVEIVVKTSKSEQAV